MKRLTLVIIAVVSLAAFAAADQINFNFTTGGPGSAVATPAGSTVGPSMLTSISDSTTGQIVPFTGNLINANAGPVTNLTNVGDIVAITFSAGGTDSVLVKDGLGNVLVSGDMRDGSAWLVTLATGAGSTLGAFDVTFVDPGVLALFHQTSFAPIGSVAFTIGSATFDPTTNTLTAAIGGGAVTIQTSVIPEPASLGLVGLGLLTVGGALRRWKGTHGSLQ